MTQNEESVSFSNIAATTSPFVIKGGRYLVGIKASNYGTVKLQQLAQDGSTYLDLKLVADAGTDIVTGSWAADGAKAFDLAAGQYRLTVASATAIYASITRVPLA